MHSCNTAATQQHSALQHTATHGNTRHHTASHCKTLQRTVTHHDALQQYCNNTATILQHTAIYGNIPQHSNFSLLSQKRPDIRWLRFVGSSKSLVSVAKEPYKREHILQKMPIILRCLLIVAFRYGVASISRPLKISGLFCKRAL